MKEIQFNLDDKVEKAMNDLLVKEQDFRKKTRPKRKRTERVEPEQLWKQLFEENLKKEGYIK